MLARCVRKLMSPSTFDCISRAPLKVSFFPERRSQNWSNALSREFAKVACLPAECSSNRTWAGLVNPSAWAQSFSRALQIRAQNRFFGHGICSRVGLRRFATVRDKLRQFSRLTTIRDKLRRSATNLAARTRAMWQ
jgi:hypothetical protein